MTDGNTYAINKHLDDQEDFEALQEIYAELEQAEAENEKCYDAWLDAQAEIVELEDKLAKVIESLQSMPEAVLHTTLDDGTLWPEDRMGVWLAALHACKNVVQSKVDRTLAELKGQADE